MRQQGDLQRLAPLMMGGAGFSYQLTASPEEIPIAEIIKRAFEAGICAIDTSPYYEPSEQLIGAALASPTITSSYKREDYMIVTKCGRIRANLSDYSPSWIRQSIARSLQRFNTTYLDVVFCHDVELVKPEEALEALGALFELADAGQIHHVGISGYDIDVLVSIAEAAKQRFGRPVDVVQAWAQLSLQNTQLEQRGFEALRKAGVKCVCCSSPLAVGLLRAEGVPIGTLGDWHPAPEGLRRQAKIAADWVAQQGDDLASVGLRFALQKARQCSKPGFLVTTITGIGSTSDIDQNAATAKAALEKKDDNTKDEVLYDGVRRILGPWVDYNFSTGKKAEER